MKNKKLFAVLSLVVCVSIFLSGNVFATNFNGVEDDFDCIVSDNGLNPEDFEEANKELVAVVKNKKNTRLYGQANTLSMKHYYQNKQPWSSDLMKPANKTIGNAGCCLTSFTMVADYYGDNVNPGQVNKIMGNYACDFEFTVAAQRFNLAITNYKRGTVSNSYARDFIGGAIMTDKPVIVGMTKGSSTHFVLAYSYVDMDIGRPAQIFIHDPAYQRDYTNLDEYFNNGYQVHRLYVYGN